MAINVSDLSIGMKVSAYDAGGFHFGNRQIAGYCTNGNIVGEFPDGTCSKDMVFVRLNAKLDHPKIISATLLLSSVSPITETV